MNNPRMMPEVCMQRWRGLPTETDFARTNIQKTTLLAQFHFWFRSPRRPEEASIDLMAPDGGFKGPYPVNRNRLRRMLSNLDGLAYLNMESGRALQHLLSFDHQNNRVSIDFHRHVGSVMDAAESDLILGNYGWTFTHDPMEPGANDLLAHRLWGSPERVVVSGYGPIGEPEWRGLRLGKIRRACAVAEQTGGAVSLFISPVDYANGHRLFSDDFWRNGLASLRGTLLTLEEDHDAEIVPVLYWDGGRSRRPWPVAEPYVDAFAEVFADTAFVPDDAEEDTEDRDGD